MVGSHGSQSLCLQELCTDIQWKLVNTNSLNEKYCLTRTVSVNQMYIECTIFILLTRNTFNKNKISVHPGFLVNQFPLYVRMYFRGS